MTFPTSNAVFFPPRLLADFIIHYDNTAFHVHKVFLHHHSAYFRSYFDTLTAPPESSDPTSKKPKRCNHPSIPHCIHLPQQTTLVEQTAVTAADFRLFLCHLYFSAHYCYPPHLPKTDIDLDTETPPVSLSFSPITSLKWCDESPLRSFDGDESGLISHESLLTLAYYLDCAAMMAQCETVLMTQVEEGKDDIEWLISESLRSLKCADRYHLSKYKKACIEVFAADPRLLDREEYEKVRETWDKALMEEVITAWTKSNPPHPSHSEQKQSL